MKAAYPFSRIIIIFNPNSTGDAPRIATQLLREISASFPSLKVELQATKRAGHALELAYDAASRHTRPLIVSVSGDGGYHEVVNGTLRAMFDKPSSSPVVTVVGAGNANDHYRAVHRKSLVKLIGEDLPHAIDLLKITISGEQTDKTVYAHSYAGLGVSPRVAQELNKYKLNFIKELYILAGTMFKLRPVKITYAGQARRVDSLVFANIHEMAKVLTLHTKTNLHDGKFEVIEIAHGSLLRFIGAILHAAISGLGPQRQYKKYTITLCENAPLQIDGEIVQCHTGDTLLVTVASGLIKVLY